VRLLTASGPTEPCVCRAFYTFETPIANGEGVVRLLRDPNDSETWKALTLSLTLASLKQYPEIARRSRPLGVIRGPNVPTKNWLEVRQEESEFLDINPQVIIVGAGHSGLMLAARLKRLGLRTLLIDKQKRLGDSWRLRYKTLVLHDVIWGDHFPYLKYPDDWPVFIPKDKIANWFESYASIMELNVVRRRFLSLVICHLVDTFLSGSSQRLNQIVLFMTILPASGPFRFAAEMAVCAK
jgi:hypothetical protein